MRLTTLAKVATFRQGNCYILRTPLSIISAIERGTINWAKWFTVRLHKEMIVVQRKARKVRNSLIKPTLILVEKHYDALEYTKEDEKEPIAHFQRLKKTRKMMF